MTRLISQTNRKKRRPGRSGRKSDKLTPLIGMVVLEEKTPSRSVYTRLLDKMIGESDEKTRQRLEKTKQVILEK